MEIIEIIAQESGERIDALLARSEDSLTRSAAQKLLDAGKVCVNGKAVRKNYKCQNGDLPLTGAVAFQQFRNIAFHISTHNSLLFSSWFGLGMKDHRADRR